MSLLTVAGFLNFLWRWRWILLPIAIYLAGMATWGWIDGLHDKNAALERERSDLIATNQATMEALDQIKAEKARNEAILADRAARKSKEADQLSAIIKRLGTYDASKDCPVSPAIDDALDGSL